MLRARQSVSVNMRGYFSTLSSPSGILRRVMRRDSPMRNSAGHTRLPMFSTKITESDPFYALGTNAQALYLHLVMLADDDGFVNNAMSAANRIPGGKTALKCLIEKRFLLQFGAVIVVKHWRIANSLKNDRVKPLSYPDVAKCIWVKANRSYTDHPVEGCKTLYEVKTGIRLESVWNPSGFPIEENRKERNRKEPKQVDSTDWFQKLWEEYPENRRGRKAEAKDAYSQCIPDDKSGAQAFENLTLWKQSEQWAKDAGQYVPYLSNWIVRGTWAVRPAKLAVPTGASGQLGEAELEAIQQVLAQPVDPDFTQE